ncbi:MAG: thiol:disulfide interchange protein DsbA/DsbL [Gammaproteobacteria bacterium]|nr:thiol:disulfide interchange protein DsbA/DsbL [Gammaproteobacteria bacterium]
MTKVERVRIALLSTLGAILAVVIGYSTLYALNLVPGWGTSTERTYNTLDRSIKDDPIEVIEFFSYACPHCASLEPMLDGWVDGLGDEIEFKRIHIAIDTLTTRLARAYLVLESQDLLEENHRRIFDAIHERNTTFLSDQQLAEFMHDRGIESDRFLSALNGRFISRSIESSRQLAIDTRTLGVPALLIANKYQVTARGGNRQMLSTADWLVEEIRAGRDPSIQPEEPSATDTNADAAAVDEAS